jgi:hypothetical protein
MTHDIVQSDIDLAKRLIKSRQSDGLIVATLICRSIEPEKAAQLVADLRSGRRVETPLVFSTESASEIPGPESEFSELVPPAAAQRLAHRKSPGRSSSRKRKRPALLWFLAIALAAAGLYFGRTAISKRFIFIQQIWKGGKSEAAHPSMAVEHNFIPVPLMLEIADNGLLLGGTRVTSENALILLSAVLGPPTRTNVLEEAHKLAYSYDNSGVLVYSQTATGNDSLIINFEAIGGSSGTRLPFTGSFKVAEHSIGFNTDSKTLTSINELGLNAPTADQGVFTGRYHGLEFYFVYLTTLQHLSLVQINLQSDSTTAIRP